MSESVAANATMADDVSRWDLPKVEGAALPRGSGGVNVMHLAAVERDAWEHGYKAGHVEGVRKGEADLKLRIAEVDVKIAALQAIIETLAKPLADLDTGIETELTRLAMIIAKHLVRRELKLDPAQVIGIVRHTVGLLPLAARNIKVHLHPDDAAILRDRLATPVGEREWELREDPLMARGGCRVTTDNASIDARVESTIAAAMRGLLGDDRAERVDAAVAAADPPAEEDPA
jgi:flagellar assembly protein FliH